MSTCSIFAGYSKLQKERLGAAWSFIKSDRFLITRLIRLNGFSKRIKRMKTILQNL